MIATNVGGVAEIINPGNGILVPSEDKKALLAAMLAIQQKSYDADQMHQEAVLKYSQNAIAAQLAAAYQQVLS
jgi:glycosyltransferase involved in cell wall biosynthesis